MTAVAYRPTVRRTQVTPYTTERRIVGTPTEVAATVDRVRRSGRLVAMTTPRMTRDDDGRVYVNVRYLAPPTRPTRTRRRTAGRTAGRVAAIAVPLVGLAAVAAYAVTRLIAELIHLLPYLGSALVVVLLVWAVLGRAGVCPGLHCPGCSHGGH
jgi:hypothetical protein